MISIDVSKYRNLPESVSPAETETLFRELLGVKSELTTQAAMEYVEALDEVADRQWHTYTRLSQELRDRLDDWIEENWDTSSLRFTELVTSIIGKVGLVRSAAYAKQILSKNLVPEVRLEIESALAEYGDSVGDPYSGMP